MYRFFLSLRFLRHHWLMTLIGSFFVGASLVILVVVMSVMDGFQSKLKETIAGSSADLTLTPRWPFDPVELSKSIEQLVPGVTAAGPYYETITLARRAGRVDPTREKMHYAAVYGIDAQREARINRFSEYLALLDRKTGRRRNPSVRDIADPFRIADELERASGTIGVVLGVGLADDIGVELNRKIRIAIAEPAKDPAGGGTEKDRDNLSFKYLQVLVVGLYESGNSEVDRSCIFMDHAAFRTLFTEDVARSSVRCRLADPDGIEKAKAALTTVLDKLVLRSVPAGVVVEPWQQQIRPESWKDKNRSLVQAIESEKSMILVIAFLIVVAGTSSIFAAQWLLVVRYIDVVHGWISWVVGRPVFDPTIYLFDRIPTLVDYGEVSRYAFAALACTLVASAIPAMRAGLMKPAEALHRD